jgi:hypothetical protein
MITTRKERQKDAGQTKKEETTSKEIHEKQEINKKPNGSRHRQYQVRATTPCSQLAARAIC